MKFGIVRFPGSNCDADAYRAVTEGLGETAVYLWHKSRDLESSDVVVLPGGFYYGDYLRGGAIARFSPIMGEVVEFAHGGGLTLGICNGFQILCEAGLLPGALTRNRGLRFRCVPVSLRVERVDTPFTSEYADPDVPAETFSGFHRAPVVQIPIAHGEGQYTADAETLDALESSGRVAFRYVNGAGEATDAANPNGSANNVAGILNEAGNVLGMMPHPERHSIRALGPDDGLPLFRSLVRAVGTS